MIGDILVDSSFYIGRLRAGADPFDDFAEHADEADFYVCGVVMIEVLRGFKSQKVHDRYRDLMGAMVYVQTVCRVLERAEAIAWDLDRKGLAMQVTDLTIATCALEVDAAVLTLDSDFDRVPGLRVIRSLS